MFPVFSNKNPRLLVWLKVPQHDVEKTPLLSMTHLVQLEFTNPEPNWMVLKLLVIEVDWLMVIVAFPPAEVVAAPVNPREPRSYNLLMFKDVPTMVMTKVAAKIAKIVLLVKFMIAPFYSSLGYKSPVALQRLARND